MKNFVLFLVLLIAVPGFGQKKGKVDPKDAQIDSLVKVTMTLTSQVDSLSQSTKALSMTLDSVSEDRDRYYKVYQAMSEKVMRYNFDPSKTPMLIDSMKMYRDSTMADLNSIALQLSDSIRILKSENEKLQNGIQDMTAAQVDKEKIVEELRQLKELLDEKIITQEEYNVKKTKLLAKWE